MYIYQPTRSGIKLVRALFIRQCPEKKLAERSNKAPIILMQVYVYIYLYKNIQTAFIQNENSVINEYTYLNLYLRAIKPS